MKNIWCRARGLHWEAEQDCGKQGAEDQPEQCRSTHLLRILAAFRVNGLAGMSPFASTQFHCYLMSTSGSSCSYSLNVLKCFSHDSHPCFPLWHHSIFPLACIHLVNVSKDSSVGKALSQVQGETPRHKCLMALPWSY